jgi:transcriptional regulator with GAF, ATPase, and Fis domain
MSGDEHVSRRDTTELRPAVASHPSQRPLALEAFYPARAAGCWRVVGELVLGRDADCAIAIADPAASRRHARVTRGGRGVIVEDLGSRNGTFVDGAAVTRADAPPGAIVRVADTLLRVARTDEAWAPAAGDGPLVGGASLAGVRRVIALVGPTELPVLVLGETGTGKELVARALHEAGARSGPFVPVNCAALPEGVAESELFGHARGAYSGAQRARKGLFAAAAGGTLFLDEVGELPAAVQAKLLRVLEDGVVRAVGDDAGQHVDVRIVSATNRDLDQAVAAGTFRADLLARLAGVEIRMPALRDRPEDLPALVTYLLARRGRAIALDADAVEALALYDWPQNVRQLDHALQAAAVNAAGAVGIDGLRDEIRDGWRRRRGVATAPVARTTPAPAAADLRDRLIAALREHAGNVRRTCAALGLARGHVYRLMDRFQIDPKQYRAGGTRLADGGDDA